MNLFTALLFKQKDRLFLRPDGAGGLTTEIVIRFNGGFEDMLLLKVRKCTESYATVKKRELVVIKEWHVNFGFRCQEHVQFEDFRRLFVWNQA